MGSLILVTKAKLAPGYHVQLLQDQYGQQIDMLQFIFHAKFQGMYVFRAHQREKKAARAEEEPLSLAFYE